MRGKAQEKCAFEWPACERLVYRACIALGLMVILFCLMACSKAQTSSYPNQVPTIVELADGSRQLEHWSSVGKAAPHINQMFRPDRPEFDGAVLWYGRVPSKDPGSGSLAGAFRALEAEGFEHPKVESIQPATIDFIRQIDSHPQAQVHIIFVTGSLSGEPAKAILYNWFGQVAESSGDKAIAHVFMAPTPIFEALGGIAVSGVYNLNATVAPGTNMLKLGRLSPDQATKKLAQLVDGWAVNYLQTQIAMMQMMGQTLSMNQQVIDSMQSYNNALSQCAGWDCTFSQDATGAWTATPD